MAVPGSSDGGLGLVLSAARTPETHYFGQRRDSGRGKEWTNLEFFFKTTLSTKSPWEVT